MYFLRLDWQITLLQAPFTLTLLWLADRVALWPSFGQSLAVFTATFVGGWIIQLAGHAVEGRRPALAVNFLQLFNAPIFLTAEVVVQLGFRDDFAAVYDETGYRVAKDNRESAQWVSERLGGRSLADHAKALEEQRS